MTQSTPAVPPDPAPAYLDGRWTTDGPGTFAVHDPATGEPVATVTDCGPQRITEAVAAARRALPTWRGLPAEERSRLLRAAADALAAEADTTAATMTAEQGKPLAEARGEVLGGAEQLRWAAEETRRLYGETVPGSTATGRIWLLPEPVGVVAAITPWNFPLTMVTRKLGPALAAGCTVVLKPSELTPLSALAVARACDAAGLPPGVVNVVPTSAPEDFARVVVGDPAVRKVSFTGSTRTGRHLLRMGAEDVKRFSVELGGHAPVLIFPDADLGAAAAGVVRAKFLNNGQSCTAPNRVYVHASIAETFTELLAAQAAALTVGRGTDPGVRLGPLIDDRALAKVTAQVDEAVRHGARLVTGGARLTGETYDSGAFYPPTILDRVTDAMRVATEETFGPVLPVLTFGATDTDTDADTGTGTEAAADPEADAEREVLTRANATPYGLASYLWSGSFSRVLRVAEALDFGMVSVNGGGFGSPQGPFGGIKGSGYGREGGHHGVEHYLHHKYVSAELS